MNKMRDYDNVTLVPSERSLVASRSDCDTSVPFCGLQLILPLIASPMRDVCNGEMAKALRQQGTMGIIHRFQSIEAQVSEFTLAVSDSFGQSVGCAVGVRAYEPRVNALLEVGCTIFCVDTANGWHANVEPVVKYIYKQYGFAHVIAGNVATVDGFNFLANLGVTAVRVGIAGGSVCETRERTGVYVPTLEAVARIREFSKVWIDGKPLIIADGGIRIPADMNKALAAGADLVMVGSVLAGTDESPGIPFMNDGVKCKILRGSASYGVQTEFNGKPPDFVEGKERVVRCKGPVKKVIAEFRGGLQGAMSMMNATTVRDFRENVHVEFL